MRPDLSKQTIIFMYFLDFFVLLTANIFLINHIIPNILQLLIKISMFFFSLINEYLP